MKNIYLFIFILCIGACKTSKVDADKKNQDDATSLIENGNQEKYEVSGIVTSSRSYCGGARPTDDVLREITSPKPLVSTEFYIRAGKENDITKKIILTFTTDENGKFSFKIPAGDYVIIENNRKDKKYYNEILNKHEKATANYTALDTGCFNTWMKGSLYQFTIIDKKLENITWDMHTRCFFSAPCVQYTGPYPP